MFAKHDIAARASGQIDFAAIAHACVSSTGKFDAEYVMMRD